MDDYDGIEKNFDPLSDGQNDQLSDINYHF